MSGTVTDLRTLNQARLRSFVLPREHGAWGILLVPLVTGATVGLLRGGALVPVLLFLLASISLFCLRTPVEAALGTSAQRIDTPAERRLVALAVAGYSAVASVALAMLLWNGNNPRLLMLGAIAAFSFGTQALLRKLGRETRLASQMVGLVGLTSTAAGAYYVSAGRFDTTAWMIWAANWLFAANQVHMVQLRLRNAKVAGLRERLARGWKFLASEILTVVLLVAFFHYRLLPKMSVIAFHPMLLRGAAWFFKKPRPLRVHRLGWMELGFALIFGTMFISGFLR
ncbi:MAG TPA: YwiC-like family protein [Terriglobales bacterium]|nr:YwiC-like family protein [Terriglobales bacterium]